MESGNGFVWKKYVCVCIAAVNVAQIYLAITLLVTKTKANVCVYNTNRHDNSLYYVKPNSIVGLF